MFILKGLIVGIRPKQFKTAEKQGQFYNVLQVMAGTDKFKQIHDVVDYNNNSFKVGDNVNFPVYVKAFVSKAGVPGLDLKIAAGDKAA